LKRKRSQKTSDLHMISCCLCAKVCNNMSRNFNLCDF